MERMPKAARSPRGASPVVALAAMVVLAVAAAARAQHSPPEDVLAWFSLDCSRLGAATADSADAQREVVRSLWRWLAPGRVIQDEASEGVVREMLGDALARGAPVAICVYRAQEEAGDGDAPAPESLRAVHLGAAVAIATPEAGAALTDHVRGLLAGMPTREVHLPGDVTGFECRRPEWASWRSITWCTRPGEVVIGLGEGSVGRWLALPSAGGGTTAGGPYGLHVAEENRVRPGSVPVLELFVDIDRLRQSFPDRFDWDAGARLLSALHLSNARSFMLQVRSGAGRGAPLLIDATWSVRSEPRASIHRLSISSERAPLGDGTSGVRAALAPNWVAWGIGGVDAYAALLSGSDAERFQKERRSWNLRRLGTLARLATSFGSTATAVFDRQGSGCPLGALVVRVPLVRGSKEDLVLRDIRAVLERFDPLISSDREERTWWLRPPKGSTGPLHSVSWGIGGPPGARELILAADFGTMTDWSLEAVSRWRALIEPR